MIQSVLIFILIAATKVQASDDSRKFVYEVCQNAKIHLLPRASGPIGNVHTLEKGRKSAIGYVRGAVNQYTATRTIVAYQNQKIDVSLQNSDNQPMNLSDRIFVRVNGKPIDNNRSLPFSVKPVVMVDVIYHSALTDNQQVVVASKVITVGAIDNQTKASGKVAGFYRGVGKNLGADSERIELQYSLEDNRLSIKDPKGTLRFGEFSVRVNGIETSIQQPIFVEPKLIVDTFYRSEMTQNNAALGATITFP